MHITFLGTGSAMPTGERNQTGILVESDGDRILVDCGSGVLGALARTDAGYESVDTVLLTHHHLDHVSDLMGLVKARWLAGAESLTVVGPAGTRDLLGGLHDVHEYMRDRIDLTVREVDPGPFELAGFSVDAMETRHSMSCLAYRFEATSDAASDGDATDPEQRPAFVFSGDSEAFTDLVEFADCAAVLAHDCSFPDDVDVSNHPTPAALGDALATADADVGRVYLTHLYPHTEGRHEEMLDSIGERYDGDVRFAEDGLSIDVTPS